MLGNVKSLFKKTGSFDINIKEFDRLPNEQKIPRISGPFEYSIEQIPRQYQKQNQIGRISPSKHVSENGNSDKSS